MIIFFFLHLGCGIGVTNCQLLQYFHTMKLGDLFLIKFFSFRFFRVINFSSPELFIKMSDLMPSFSHKNVMKKEDEPSCVLEFIVLRLSLPTFTLSCLPSKPSSLSLIARELSGLTLILCYVNLTHSIAAVINVVTAVLVINPAFAVLFLVLHPVTIIRQFNLAAGASISCVCFSWSISTVYTSFSSFSLFPPLHLSSLLI